jgi:hypothetical protein
MLTLPAVRRALTCISNTGNGFGRVGYSSHNIVVPGTYKPGATLYRITIYGRPHGAPRAIIHAKAQRNVQAGERDPDSLKELTIDAVQTSLQ